MSVCGRLQLGPTSAGVMGVFKKKKDPGLDNCEARAAGDPSAHLRTLGATITNRPVLIFPVEPSQRSRNCGRLVLLGLV